MKVLRNCVFCFRTMFRYAPWNAFAATFCFLVSATFGGMQVLLLRNIVDGLGGRMQGVPREDGFEITVASEIMAVLCLSNSITDLKERLGRMIVAYTYDGKPVTAHDLKAEGAMAALLKDALKPNLVQTLEGTPAFIHGGPFANIAHGCNSIMATKAALKQLIALTDRAELLVVVSNDVFGDGGGYDPETERYIRWLGELHRELARMGAAAVEIVCGLAAGGRAFP